MGGPIKPLMGRLLNGWQILLVSLTLIGGMGISTASYGQGSPPAQSPAPTNAAGRFMNSMRGGRDAVVNAFSRVGRTLSNTFGTSSQQPSNPPLTNTSSTPANRPSDPVTSHTTTTSREPAGSNPIYQRPTPDASRDGQPEAPYNPPTPIAPTPFRQSQREPLYEQPPRVSSTPTRTTGPTTSREPAGTNPIYQRPTPDAPRDGQPEAPYNPPTPIVPTPVRQSQREPLSEHPTPAPSTPDHTLTPEAPSGHTEPVAVRPTSHHHGHDDSSRARAQSTGNGTNEETSGAPASTPGAEQPTGGSAAIAAGGADSAAAATQNSPNSPGAQAVRVTPSVPGRPAEPNATGGANPAQSPPPPPPPPAPQQVAPSPSPSPSPVAEMSTRLNDDGLSSNFKQRCTQACVNGDVEVLESDFNSPAVTMIPHCPTAPDSCRPLCQEKCSELYAARKTQVANNRSGSFSRDSDSCGDAAMFLIADKIATEPKYNHYTRAAIFKCIKQGTGPMAGNGDCEEVRKARPAIWGCDTQKTLNKTVEVVDQAADMVLQATAKSSATKAATATESAALNAANGDTSINVQKTALENAAGALEATAERQSWQAGIQFVVGAAQATTAAMHAYTASELAKVGKNETENQVNVGADANGNLIKGNALALIGSSRGGAKTGDDVTVLEGGGADAVSSAATARKAMAEQTFAQAMTILSKGAMNTVQQDIYRDQAAELRKKANELTAPREDLGKLAPPDPTNNTDVTSNNTDLQRPGNGNEASFEAKAEVVPDATPSIGASEMPAPGGPGGAPSSGLRDNPTAMGSTVNGVGGGSGAAGGGASAAGGGDSGAGAGDGKDGGGEHMIAGAQAQNAFQSVGGGGGGGGGYNNASGKGGKSDTGMDLNGLLAQFLPKKDDEAGAKNGQSSILDYGSQGGKNGARGPAGSSEPEDGSILGPNSNLFMRVSNTVTGRYKRGDLR